MIIHGCLDEADGIYLTAWGVTIDMLGNGNLTIVATAFGHFVITLTLTHAARVRESKWFLWGFDFECNDEAEGYQV